MNKKNLEAVYKLSPMQEGILFHFLLSPGTGSYLEQSSWPLLGALDLDIYLDVWRGALERHQILRTSFLWEELDQPLQVVHRQLELPVSVLDWSQKPNAEQERDFSALIAQDRVRNFDLMKPPLMRLTIIKLSEEKHQVIWTYHHLLMDGWASALVLGEVEAHLNALRAGQTWQGERLRPYRDYINWLEKCDLTEAKGYWCEKLSGLTAPTELPIIANTPKAGQTEAYAQKQIAIPAQTVSQLKQRAREGKLTFYTLVQAAWSVLLSRYSGAADVLFGTTTSGRTLPISGIEKMVGVFINTLPNRINVDPKAELVSWLREQQSEQMRLNKYEYTPLPQLRAWSDIPGSLPFFESILVYENYSQSVLTPNTHEEKLGHFDVDTTTNFPLTLIVYPVGELLLRVLYDISRVEEAAVTRLLGHLQSLIEDLSQDLNKTVGQLNMVSPEERQQLLVGFNQSEEPYDRETDLFTAFRNRALGQPDQTALCYTDANGQPDTVSYGQLLTLAEELGACLQERGVIADQLVGVCFDRGLEMMVGLLGTLASGAAYLPLDSGFPQDRLNYMLDNAGATVLLTSQANSSALAADDRDIIGLNTAARVAEPAASKLCPVGAGSARLAYAIYTSGSTGKPKGVMISQGALMNFMVTMARKPGMTANDRLLAVTTVSFDIAALELYLPLLAGGRLIIATKDQCVDASMLIELMDTHKVNLMQATPATWRMLLADGWVGKPNLRMFCGGEALPAELAEQLQDKGAELWNLYGPTETTIWSGARRVLSGVHEAAVEPVGPPIGNTAIYILDDLGRPQPVGITGHIFIGGDSLARGYRGLPAMTAERFVPNPFVGSGRRLYNTGDLGRFDQWGTITFLGRSDHQIKLRGFRIELGEIDAALSKHETVQSAATVLQETQPGDHNLVAFLVAQGTEEPNHESLRQHLARTLPKYMVPTYFQVLEKMPLNTSGKVDRGALPKFGGVARCRVAHIGPRTEAEGLVAQIWKDVLKLDEVGVNDNFFDIGGHSLRLVQVRSKVQKAFGQTISMTDLLEFTTVATLAAFLRPEQTPKVVLEEVEEAPAFTVASPAASPDDAIAVIGKSGRFPGAPDVATYWQNIQQGSIHISFFSKDELLGAGVEAELVNRDNYVRARGVLDNIEMFDAAFFGMTPREATVTDPQHRILLEGAWQALEDAAYNPDIYPGRIGVYAGGAINTYALFNIMANRGAVDGLSFHQFMIANDTSYLTTRLSYKLNLSGPSMSVQTACSTSLVALVQACRELLAGHCDMALAGGVAITSRQQTGYLYEEGGIGSPDGYCRPFDQRAGGTVFSSGMGMLVLKPLSAAQSDGDNVQAIIRGFATNNDGSAKAGYTAPSVDGQTKVIRAAQKMADITPASIGYVETHGTATPLGDPIEITALNRAFQSSELKPGSVAIGSVKANIGHLDTAAGVASVIKTILLLQHRKLPPSPYFEKPSAALDLDDTPFYVNREMKDWSTPAGAPRRAAVSSFGIGGTNAHVILEEAPVQTNEEQTGPHLFPLSAKTPEALSAMAANLAAFLKAESQLPAADVAYTLQVGRKNFPFRSVLVGTSIQNLVTGLEADLTPSSSRALDHPVVFMFAGQCSQYSGMGRIMYQQHPTFAKQLDRCAELLEPLLGSDIRQIMWAEENNQQLAQTATAQPVLFAFEYALARLWLSWGVQPAAMIGHSLGEYVAACLAGVFTLQEGLNLLVARGRIMQDQPLGAMLGVAMGQAEITPLLSKGLVLATVNGPNRVVIAGSNEDIGAFEATLKHRNVHARRLATTHAFHSHLMEGAVEPFKQALSKLKLKPPAMRFISNVSGTWITEEQATDPNYWTHHLRHCVRFGAGLETLLTEPGRILLEIGPEDTLTAIARPQIKGDGGHAAIASLPKSSQGNPLHSLGRLWQLGAGVDWNGFNAQRQGRRRSLPGYAFQRQRYWIDPIIGEASAQASSTSTRHELADMFYMPAWKPAPASLAAAEQPVGNWLVFHQGQAFDQDLVEALRGLGAQVTEVLASERFARDDEMTYHLKPGSQEDHEALIRTLANTGAEPQYIAHLWNLGEDEQATLQRSFYSLVGLARALGQHMAGKPVTLAVLANQLLAAESADTVNPIKATLLGPVKVIRKEFAHITSRALDLNPAFASPAGVIAEIRSWKRDGQNADIALRGRKRLISTYEQVEINEPNRQQLPLREGGVYLITGGLGGMGLVFARYLAEKVGARLVLTSRAGLPERGAWPQLLQSGSDEAAAARIREIQQIEARGGEVMVLAADVTDSASMTRVKQEVLQRFGRIDAVIHAAGLPGGGMIQLKTPQAAHQVLAPKVEGTLVLASVLCDLDLDFVVLCSSLTAILGEFGQVDYCSANAFMDAFAEHNQMACKRVISVNWPAWKEVGMALSASLPENLRQAREDSLKKALTNAEGIGALERLLAVGESRMAVTPQPLNALIMENESFLAADLGGAGPEMKKEATVSHPRPNLASEYQAPRSKTEKALAAIWMRQIGVDKVGINDNFFELGGDSLLGLQVVTEMNSELGVEITAARLYEAPTVAAVAAIIDPGEAQAPATLTKNQSRGSSRKDKLRRKRKKTGTR